MKLGTKVKSKKRTFKADKYNVNPTTYDATTLILKAIVLTRPTPSKLEW